MDSGAQAMTTMNISLGYVAASSLVALITSIVTTRAWIRVAHERGLVGRDMNKPGRPRVAEAGGVWPMIAGSFGVMTLIALYRYLSGIYYHIAETFALVALLLLSALLGFLDDLLGWKKGLPRWQRIVFMAPISLPLVVIKAGVSRIALPVIGVVNLGLLYPLVAVPVGILGAANAFNMIAGYNGLEATMAILLSVSIAAFSAIKGLYLVSALSAIMALAVLGFLVYNWYPAKVFPGNTFTYGFGAYYAALVILGNMEKAGIAFFTLYFIEFLLFVRGLLNGVYKENFAKVLPDGTLAEPYDKIYSLTHLAIRVQRKLRGKATEPGVVAFIALLQCIISLLVILVYAVR